MRIKLEKDRKEFLVKDGFIYRIYGKIENQEPKKLKVRLVENSNHLTTIENSDTEVM